MSETAHCVRRPCATPCLCDAGFAGDDQRYMEKGCVEAVHQDRLASLSEYQLSADRTSQFSLTRDKRAYGWFIYLGIWRAASAFPTSQGLSNPTYLVLST